MTSNELVRIGVHEIRAIFGLDYLLKNRERCAIGSGIVYDGVFLMTINIKTKEDTPQLPEGDKGWTVYAEIVINAKTGRVISRKYQTEDGKAA